MTVRLVIQPLARSQVDHVADYIRLQGQPAAGLRFIDRFLDACDLLTNEPLAGHVFESRFPRHVDIRMMVIKGYAERVYYRVVEDAVVVLAVVSGRQSEAAVEKELGR